MSCPFTTLSLLHSHAKSSFLVAPRSTYKRLMKGITSQYLVSYSVDSGVNIDLDFCSLLALFQILAFSSPQLVKNH